MIILIDLNHFKQEGNNSPFKLLIPFMVSIEREMIVNCDCSSKTPNERAAIWLREDACVAWNVILTEKSGSRQRINFQLLYEVSSNKLRIFRLLIGRLIGIRHTLFETM